MVWFTFSFLLGIPNVKKEKEHLKESLESKNDIIEIEVSKPYFSCHIEYVLFPKEPTKCIDVNCWEKAAKIYFDNTSLAIMPYEDKNLQWIHFRVNHKLNLKVNDVPFFYSNNIVFTIYVGVRKLGNPAKNDNVKKFYGPSASNTNIRKQLFQPLSENESDLTIVSFFKEHLTSQQQLYISLDTTAEIHEHFGKLYKRMTELSEEYHSKKHKPTPISPEHPAWITLSELQDRKEYLKKFKLAEEKEKKKEPVGEKVKKKETRKVSLALTEEDGLEFTLTGEVLLSGHNPIENCIKYNSKALPILFCLASVRDALSRSQSEMYNILSMNLTHIDFLPSSLLSSFGITELKLHILVGNEFLAESHLMPISNKMKIKYIRSIFTNNVDNSKLINFIQTGGLKIDLLGNYAEIKEEPKEHLYKVGSLKNKVSLRSKIPDKPSDGFVLLGTTTIDISSLLFAPYRLLVKKTFSPVSDSLYKCTRQNDNGTTTVNEFNACCEKKSYQSYWNSYNAPLLTIKISLSYSLCKVQQAVSANPKLFNRIFIVLCNLNLAAQIIKVVQDEIDEFLQPVDFLRFGKTIQRPILQSSSSHWNGTNDNKSSRMTGFAVDCVDKIFIYVEGPVCGGIQKIWALASSLHPKEGQVLYDSSLIFTDRLYEKFFKFGGFLTITMAECPNCGKTFTDKTLPQPAWKAVAALNALLATKSIKNAIKNDLFPDSHCLTSLAVECGVPVLLTDKMSQFSM